VAHVTMKQLLEAGVHFGHQTRRWNPKMRPYIYGERNGIHIIDLRQTLDLTERSAEFAKDLAAGGGVILFVGTKRQAQAAIAQAADRSGMPYVNFRWLGGMLTNFTTIQKRIFYMKELERMEASGEMDALPKKERLRLRRELFKLQQNLGGVRSLTRLPDALFVVDLNVEHTAIREAARLGLPVVALVDSNCDPDPITYVIPGNDDAIRAVDLIAGVIAEAMREGAGLTTKDDDVFDEALADHDETEEGGVEPAAEETVGVEAAS
jgi:small subunit ribosomal protein S2